MMLSIHDGCQIPFIPENHGLLGTSVNVSRETGGSDGPSLMPQLCCPFLARPSILGLSNGPPQSHLEPVLAN